MKECFYNTYINNNEFKPCAKFNKEILSEGIAIFEVIRVIEGIPLFLERHLNRLANSAKMANVILCLNKQQITVFPFRKVHPWPTVSLRRKSKERRHVGGWKRWQHL